MTKITFKQVQTEITKWVREHVVTVSAETLGWMAALFIHFSIIPTLLAAMEIGRAHV